jgi:hypothetical protein
MATRVAQVGKQQVHATALGSATVSTPVTISASAGANIFHTVNAPVYHWTVAAGTYTTLTTLVTALNASTATAGSPALATVLTFSKTGSKIKATYTGGQTYNGQTLAGTPATQIHLNSVAASGGATGPARLWQTTIGYTGTPAITATAGLFYPGTSNDPLPITIENQGAHTVFIAQGHGATAVTKTTGTKLTAGGSLSFSNIGTDKLYAIATTATAAVSVMVGKRP